MNTIWKNLIVKPYSIATNYFERNLEKRFPNAYFLYNKVKVGVTLLTKDTIIYFKVSKAICKNGDISEFNWKKMLAFQQIPLDWKKVTPVMILSAAPFANYVVYPLAFLLPEKLLSQQFWCIEQKAKFYSNIYNKRLILRTNVVNSLAKNVDLVKDIQLKNAFIDVLDNVRCIAEEYQLICIKQSVYQTLNHFNNQKPITGDQLLDIKLLFVKNNFTIYSLSHQHLKDLSKIHDCSSLFEAKTRRRLVARAYIQSKIDFLLPNNLEEIDQDSVYTLIHQRGLNPSGRTFKELLDYINDWQQFSKKLFSPSNYDVNREYYSLYLHAKILLSQNYKSNTENEQPL